MSRLCATSCRAIVRRARFHGWCSPPPAQPKATTPEPAPQTYEVKSGDSLSRIARQFYGNANEWRKIYEANRDQIKDPDLIYPGQRLRIP